MVLYVDQDVNVAGTKCRRSLIKYFDYYNFFDILSYFYINSLLFIIFLYI